MDFSLSAATQDISDWMWAFMRATVFPAEARPVRAWPLVARGCYRFRLP